jgi:mannose-6-phosphate isomerase-like protein (cupin superfamily)
LDPSRDAEESDSVDATSPTHESGTARVWYLQTAQSSAGAVHEQRVEYAPGSPFPPAHLHPAQDEHFEVEQGRMLFVVDGAERIVSAGETLDIPRGTTHRARNASRTEVAVVRWETRPALRTTEFFTTAAQLGDGMGLLDAGLLASEFRDVFRPTGMARWLVPVIARVAVLGGRRLPGR